MKQTRNTLTETNNHGSCGHNLGVDRFHNYLAEIKLSQQPGLNFMAIINVRIYKGSYHESHSGCNFTPSVIIHGQIPYKLSNLSSP